MSGFSNTVDKTLNRTFDKIFDFDANKIMNESGKILDAVGKVAYLAAGFFALLSVTPIIGTFSLPQAALCFLVGHELTKVGPALQSSTNKATSGLKALFTGENWSEKAIKGALKDTWVLKHVYTFISPLIKGFYEINS